MESDDVMRELRDIRDRAAIIEAMSTFAACMDGQEPERAAEVFTDDIVVEHSGGSTSGRERVIAGLTAAVRGHFTSHHMMSNHRVRIDGDSARMVCYFHSVHLDDPTHPERHADHGGWYLLALVRSGSGWRISRLKQVSVWSAADRKPAGPLDAAILPEVRDYLGD